jgi:hypothetical protein
MKEFKTLWNERQEKKKSQAVNNTSGQTEASVDDFMTLWNQRKQKRGDYKDPVQSYFAEVQRYIDRANKDEGRLAYSNAAPIRQANADATGYLRRRGENLKSYLYEQGYNDEYVEAVLADIDRATSQLDTFDNYFLNVSDYYSQFATQAEYDQAVKESGWYNTYSGKTADELLVDLGNLEKDSEEYNWVSNYAAYQDQQEKLEYDPIAGQQKIDTMNADLERFEELTNFYNSYRDYLDNGGDHARDMDTQSKLAQYYQLAKKYGSVDGLQREITAEEQRVNLSKRAQQFVEMSGVGIEGAKNYDPQFDEKSAYQSTEATNGWDVLTSEWTLGYGDLVYEYINNAAPDIRAKIRAAEKEYGTRNRNDVEWDALDKMSAEEIATYNYYYATGGKEAADEYLSLIEEGLNYEVALDTAASKKNDLERYFFGVEAGLDQFKSNWQNIGNTADYIAPSSRQIASGLVREDLADARLNPNKTDGISFGQAVYDAISTTSNMAPSILASVAIGAFSKTAGSIVGSALMGSTAASGAYQEKLNAGYSKDDARAYGTLVGASEIVMEKVLGGITALGGGALSDIVLRNISGLDKALGKFAQSAAGKILMNAGSEALEEFTQSVIEPYMWQAISGEEMSIDWEEAAYSAMLGFVTGGFFESATTGTAAATQAIGERSVGKTVINTKGGIENLNAAAASMSSTASPEMQRQIAKAQEKASTGKARAVGQLYNTVSAEVTKADIADIVKSLNRKGIKGDAATQMADIIVNKLGNNLTSYGEEQFNAIMRDKRVQTVVSDLIDNKMSTVGQRNQKLAAATGKEASTIDVAKIKEQQRTEFVEENNEYDVAANQQTINTKTGAEVKVNDIAEITDKGVVNVRLDDGSVVNAADLSYATEDIALAYSALKGKPMSAENANRLFKMSEGMDAAEFYEAVEDGYERGYANLAKPEGEVAAAAYEAGAAQRASDGGKEAKKTRKSGINRIGRDGNISVISADEDVSDKGFNKRQLTAVQTIQALEKLDLGTAFFVIESYKVKVNGKTHIVFTDENGQVKDAPNGMYYKDGRVYIDINAGRGATGKFVLQTAAHELAHHIQQWNPSKYKVLADFLAAEYGKQGVDAYAAIKAKQQELSKIRGRSVSFNEAYHEWVADNLSVMFNDGNLYDKLVKLKHKDSALFNEIRKFIDDLAKRVRKVFGMDGAETAEGKFVLSWDPRVIDRLQQIYAEALVESSERYAQAAYVENQSAEVQESTKNDGKYMDAAIRMNTGKGLVKSTVMQKAAEVRAKIAETMKRLEMDKRVALPEDVEGNTAIANSSYDVTEENTTICPRSLASEAFVDAVSEMLGRPLTVAEQLHISQDLQGRTLTPECLYCYVATDRKAYRAFLGSYVQQRDAVIKAYKDGNTDTSRDGSLYQQFLDGRKDTSNMWKRFNLWINTHKSGKPMVQASHLANISKLMGDINAEFGADLKAQIKDAMAYAQSASWAKKRISYVAYNGHILRWKQDRINKLNSHYGLRMYSFSDFSPAFILENMQMITDAAVRGLKMLGYTKEIDFVKIFAKTGMNINVSTFGFEAGGNVYENNIIGANWAEAQKLREQYPNVGITFVATNDTLVEWALAQDWIDVVIPYHLVRTGAEVAAALNYKNYTSESSDVKDIGWKKGVDEKYIAPTVHNNDFDTYMEALKKNHLKPRFERFIDNPNYMKLVNETRQSAAESKPVQPVFDYAAATESLAKLETDGYYKPIGDTVERMYEIAAEVANKLEPEPVELADVQFMSRTIESVTRETVIQDLTEVYNGINVTAASYIPISKTTPFAVRFATGYKNDLPIIVDKKKAYFDMRPDGKFKEDKSHHYHNMGIDGFVDALNILEDPEYVIEELMDNGKVHYAFIAENENGEEVSVAFEMSVFKPEYQMNGYPKGYYNLDITSFVATEEWLVAHGMEPGDSYVDYLLSFPENRAVYRRETNLEQLEKARAIEVGSAGLAASHINSRAFEDIVAQGKPKVKIESSQKSDRLTEPSTREILATALEGTAKTELEQKVISEYIETIPKLNEQEAKLNELNAQIREISFGKGPRDTKKLNQLKTEAAKTRNRINILDKKLLRIESTVPLQRVIETEKAKAIKREKARSKEALAAAKERSAQKIAEVRKTYQESRANSVAGRRKTEMRHKIQRVVKQLNDLLLHETKEKHIPKNLKKAVADALDFVNMDTVGADERIAKYEAMIAKETDPAKIDAYTATIENIRRQGERSGEMLNALKDAYKEISKSNDPEIMNAYDAEIYGNLAELAATIGNTSLRDMTIEQLQDVYSMYRMVLTTVQNANKLFREGRKETLVQLTQKVYNEIDAVPHKERDLPPAMHKVQRWLRNFSWNELRPVDAFDRVGSKEFTELFWDIIKAQGEYGHMVEEVMDFMTTARKKHNYSKWDLTKAKTYDTVNGKQFKVTLADAMSIYAYSKRDQAHDHMTDGGFTYDTGRTYKDEKNGRKVSPVLSTPYRVTEEEIGEIIGSLTKEQRAYVDEVQQFLTDFGKKGNVVSNALWGIDLFTEKMYFPLKSSKDYRSSTEQALNATQTMVSLKNNGMTKATVPHANNPIVLRAFDDVVLEHLDTMSKYAAYVLPVENIQRVFNSVAKNSNEDYVSIQSLLTSVFGDSATAYFNQYIKDINGNTASTGAQSPIGSFFSKSKAAAVAANLSVVIQQYSSIVRAMADIHPKFFNWLNRPTKTTRKTYEEIKKYAGVAVIKEMGGFDVGSNRGIKDFVGFEEAPASREKAWKKFQNLTGWGAQTMDKVGWNTIWNAVKRETTASGKFRVGSEEFYQECGRRFTEVVTKTQVYDSVNSRSGFMRSKSDSVKYLTTYMGEPTVMVGMVFRSHLNLVRAVQSKQGVGAAAKNLARTGAVLACTMMLNAALKSVAYAMRDDDEDEAFIERWAKSVGDSVRDDLNIFNMLPVFRDIMSVIDGWDVERPDMTLIAELVNTTKAMVAPFLNKEKMEQMEPADWWNNSVKLVGAIGNAFGVPLRNVIRDITGVVRLFGDITDELKPEDVGGAFVRGLTGKEQNKADSLYDAIVSDETSRLEFLRTTYDSEADYEKAVMNALRDNDDRIEAAAEARYSGNWSEYERIFGEIEAEGNFTRSQIAGAVESAMRDLEPEEAAGEPEVKNYGIYNKNDFAVAVFSGDKESAEKIRNEIVKFMVAEGKTKDEANKSLDSFIRDSVKDWLETGDVDRNEAISLLATYTDYDTSDATAKVDYWMYAQENPDIVTYEAWMGKYYDYAEPAGISLDDYMQYRVAISGVNGEGKKQKILEIIDGMPFTIAQKDALYLSNGWAESKLNEAPWH